MIEKIFIIMIGRSGCGKGTQSQLLVKYFEDKYKSLELKDSINITHVTTGEGFRKLISGDTYTANISKEITNTGGLNPEFLAIWNWGNIFINNI